MIGNKLFPNLCINVSMRHSKKVRQGSNSTQLTLYRDPQLVLLEIYSERRFPMLRFGFDHHDVLQGHQYLSFQFSDVFLVLNVFPASIAGIVIVPTLNLVILRRSSRARGGKIFSVWKQCDWETPWNFNKSLNHRNYRGAPGIKFEVIENTARPQEAKYK